MENNSMNKNIMKGKRTGVCETHNQQKVQHKNQLEAVMGKLFFKQKFQKCNRSRKDEGKND